MRLLQQKSSSCRQRAKFSITAARHRPLLLFSRIREDDKRPDDAALPVVSNQKMNDALKVLFKMAGLDKPITKTYFVGSERRDVTKPLYERISTHVGRKTFVVTGLSSGLSPYTITQWTGHSSRSNMHLGW